MQIGICKRPRHAPFRFHLIASNLQKWDLTYTNSNAAVVTDPVTGQVIETKAKFEFGDKLMRHMTIGTEVLLGENFTINIGYNYRRRQELKMPDRPATAGVSFGFGMKVKKFNLSYGRAIYNASGPSNHLTISTQLGQWF